MYEIYTIEAQDTLGSIASKYKTTEQQLSQINGLGVGMAIYPGMQLVVPVNKEQPYRYYTVKKGDNLYQIAKEQGVDYQLLLQLNGLDKDDYIYPNQTLLLPKEGIDIYLTKEDDTIQSLIKQLGVTIEDLMKENGSLYLRAGQMIAFSKK